MISKNTLRIFAFLFLQTLISISIGLIFLFISNIGTIAPGISINGIDVGGYSIDSAKDVLKEKLDKIIENKEVQIIVDDNNIYSIDLRNINASIDYDTTLTKTYSKNKILRTINLLSGHFLKTRKDISPEISYNEGKLRAKIEEFANSFNFNPQNASIEYINGEIAKKEHKEGLEVNEESIFDSLTNKMGFYINNPLKLYSNNSNCIKRIKPKITIEQFDGVNEIIAQAYTPIALFEDSSSIKPVISVIDKLFVLPASQQPEEFCLKKCLKENKIPKISNNEVINATATTLFQALLIADIDIDAISRVPNENTVEYAMPGTDASLEGNNDLKFTNTLDSKLVFFASIESNHIVIRIAGKEKKEGVSCVLENEIVQIFEPPIIYSQNSELLSGETQVAKVGKEGLIVNVYRVKIKDGQEISKEKLYTDEYKATDTIIYVGLKTRFPQLIDK